MEHDVRMDGATVTISHRIDFNSVLAQNRSVNGVPDEFSLFGINIESISFISVANYKPVTHFGAQSNTKIGTDLTLTPTNVQNVQY